MSSNPPSQDILKRFPYEIWSKCISTAIYRAPEGPLPFLGVSSHWQRLLLDSPEMWSYIHIQDGEDLRVRAHIFLQLSGQYPLEVAIDFIDSLCTDILSTVIPHKDRIHSIHILQWPPHLNQLNQTIRKLLTATIFPAVTTIGGTQRSPSCLGPLLTACPQLRYTSGIVFTNEEDNKWISEGLRTIDFQQYEHLLESLPLRIQPFLRLPSLERLTMGISHQDSSEKITPDAFALSSKTLQELFLSTSLEALLQGILRSPLKNLQSLSITTSIGHFHTIIDAFPSLSSLRFAFLGLIFDQTEPKNIRRLQQTDIPRLRELNISTFGEGKASIFEALIGRDALVCVEVFKFHMDMDRSNTNTTQIVDHIPQLLYALRNARHITLPPLKTIDVSSYADSGLKFPIQMPNLMHLVTASLAPMAIIDPPSLHSLSMTSTIFIEPTQIPSNFGRNVVNLRVRGDLFNKLAFQQPDHWHSVETIIWGGTVAFVDWKMASFRSLCSIELGWRGRTRYTADARNPLNCFLIQLLKYPDAYPNLRTLKSDRYPIWPLLGQVMLQRNQNRNHVQLQDIWLPNLPTFSLLSLIVRLLNGSDEVIPMKVNDTIARRLQHGLFSTCIQCICAGYTQCLGNRKYLDRLILASKVMENRTNRDLRDDPNYLGLLDLEIDVESKEERLSLTLEEWEVQLESMDTVLKGLEHKGSFEIPCSSDKHEWAQIHKYILHQ